MIPQIPGKIFLAAQRGLAETNEFRRHSTFSFGNYAHPDKAPFGRLYGFNEEVLAAGHSLELPVVQASFILLLPITGALGFGTAQGQLATVDVEETQLITAPAGSILRLSNLYEDELISFLHIWLAADVPITTFSYQSAPFDLEAAENQLVGLTLIRAEHPFSVTIGRFTGRSEAIYQLRCAGGQLFAFVLTGAFEFEGRLLHERDGLALWQATAIELEALSNHAIVIIIELS